MLWIHDMRFLRLVSGRAPEHFSAVKEDGLGCMFDKVDAACAPG